MRVERGIWHGWTNTLTDGGSPVTSRRLHADEVANRWFPKVRSWIRLGAPIELLSPLSVARILVITALLTWPAMAVFASLPLAVMGALIGWSGLALVALSRTAALTPAVNSAVASSTLGALLIALGAAGGERRALATVLVVVSLSTFLGLFLRLGPMLTAILVQSIAITSVVRVTHDGVGFSGSVLLVVAGALVALMAASMARTSRLAGSLDADTGVPNARGLRTALDSMSQPALVVTVRLGGVAAAREALGHDAGSELIRRSVEDLGQVISSDARVGRGADDEVVVIVPAGDDPERTKQAAQAWVESALGQGRYLVGDIEVVLEHHVGFATGTPAARLGERTAGTATSPASDESGPEPASMAEALRHSALAARRAEAAGAAARTWDGAPGTLTADDLALLADLRSATERGEMWLAYQPLVRTPDGAVVSVEALLRWEHPVLGQVSPGRFIPLAEQTGLIDLLTDWVLIEALDAQLRWRDEGRDVSVSINVSPLSLRRSDFASRISDQLLHRSLPPSCLTVEVTESSTFDVPVAVERLAPLRELGVKIAIDDFGTGYTSLAILPQLPLDEIKIDQRFVRDVLVNPASDAIVRSMCELAHRVGLIAVAEGAEDQQVVDHLTVAGYDLIQGYFFARPMPEADLVDWLDERQVPVGDPTTQRSAQAFVGRAEATDPVPSPASTATPTRTPSPTPTSSTPSALGPAESHTAHAVFER